MSRDVKSRATVKLQFVATDRKRHIISRTVDATQNPKQISIKTIDGTLTHVGPDGNKRSLSNNCSDVNENMLMLLGVSKPILNYVIFCHQEDSNWPLDEGSKVKDKFDDIFASKVL
jgi:DNA repair protein RAD50